MRVSLRQKKLKDNRVSLYLDFYETGKKRQVEYLNLYLEQEKRGDKSIKENNKTQIELANKIRAKRENELAHTSNGYIPKSKAKTNFVTYFEKVANKKDVKTKMLYITTLNNIKGFKKGDLSFQDIDKQFIENFIEFLKEKNYHTNSMILFITLFKSVCNQAIKDEIISKNPFVNATKLKPIKKKREYLTLDEIQKMFEMKTQFQDVKNMFLFACFTGLRISDIIKLTWQNIQNDTISIIQKKTKEPLIFPLTEPAKQILSLLDKSNSIIFANIDKNNFNYYLQRIIKSAQIDKKVTIHTARHSFAVNYLSLGGDIFVLKELLGHSLLTTTLIYSEVINERKTQAVKLFPKMNFNLA